MQPHLVERLLVAGVGLIGGSFALALKEAGCVGEVVGFDADPAHLSRACELGILDRGTTDPAEAALGATLVFLAVPVRAMGAVAASLFPHLEAGAVVTDSGSVKTTVIRELLPRVPAGVHFVPGHPIAGTERSGPEAAFAALFRDRRCILTPLIDGNVDALEQVTSAWKQTGCEVVCMEADHHDAVFAAISHLPHMVAYALVNAVAAEDPSGESVLRYSAGGFRDFTRIASSDPVMWRDIALENRDRLLGMMDRFEVTFRHLRALIEAGDASALEHFFKHSKHHRDSIAR